MHCLRESKYFSLINPVDSLEFSGTTNQIGLRNMVNLLFYPLHDNQLAEYLLYPKILPPD